MSMLLRSLVLPLLALALSTTSAHADPSAADKESARSFAEQGDKLFAAHDYAGALKVYKAAHTIMRVPTTGVRLARTQALVGQLVEARDTYLEVARYPVAPREPPPFTNARNEAAQEAQSMAARIPSVEITVSGPPAGAALTVTIDDASVPGDALGLPRKVNPGPHHVKAAAPGFLDATSDVTVKEAEVALVPLVLVASPVEAQAAIPAPAHEDAPRESSRHGTRAAGFVVGGVGVAALAAGAVFGFEALSKKSDRNANCNAAITVCNQTGIDDDTHGRTFATLSTVGLAAGIVGVGVGTWLVLRTSSGSVSMAPAVGTNGGGLTVRGAF